MTTPLIPQDDFTEITQLIATARQRAMQAVNAALIELYWQVGLTISRKIAAAEWGDGVVEYALSRNLSPALIAEYQTQLPDKVLLQAKLHGFYLQNAPDDHCEDDA